MAKKTADIELMNALGFRRICPNCGTKYYDMNKQPPACPTCQAVFDPEGLVRTRRRAMIVDKEVPENQEAEEEEVVEEDEADIEIDADIEEDDEEGEDLIEDASELEGDDDDLLVEVDDENEEE